jgi:hypothetical protein
MTWRQRPWCCGHPCSKRTGSPSPASAKWNLVPPASTYRWVAPSISGGTRWSYS